MLELLIKYGVDHGLESEPGFKSKSVRWAIICSDQGQFLDVVELGDTNLKRNPGQTFPKCPDLSQPEMVSGNIRSHFLTDSAEVVLLFGKSADVPKTLEKHAYFLNLLRQASVAMPSLAVLADILTNEEMLETIRSRMEDQRAKPTDKVTFRLCGLFPIESDAWHDWWRGFKKTIGADQEEKRSSKKKRDSSLKMRCFVTGERITPVATHPKIEGLAGVGGQPTGDALICFDKDAFCSYGLEQSSNSAVSENAAAAYRSALNKLIRESGQRLAKALVVHWFKQSIPPEDDPLSWLQEGDAQQEINAQQRAKAVLQSIKTGQRIELMNNEFYAFTFSGAAGRVMVRDWMEGQFEELVTNVNSWFNDLSIVHREGGTTASNPKFLAVLGATVRDLKELPAPFIAKMWRVAIRREPIPLNSLAQALERFRIDVIQDQPFNHARMGLIKAYHIRKNRKKGEEAVSDIGPYLNEDHPHPAYQCGRLMAVMAELQHRALGDVGAGVVQRYYAAASVTPALVFGRLTRTAQFHLNKLDPGLARWFETRIADIWARIKDSVPRTLELEDQSLFALGYYQQMAEMRKRKTDSPAGENKEEKNNE